MLDATQVEAFKTDGFLVIPDFISPSERAALLSRTASIIDGADLSQLSSVFSTRNQRTTTDEYFLRSSCDVSFFLEEGALNAAGEITTASKAQALNKIGHALHYLDPEFTSFARSAKCAELLRDVGMLRPTPVQSMIIMKNAGVGGEVVPHQDSAFLYTSPPTCIGLWFALEDANRDNGCLWALRASHPADGQPAARFVLTPERTVTWSPAKPEWADRSSFEPIEVKAGACVVLHGANVHCSYPNTSDVSRLAFSIHYVEKDAEWARDNWLQGAPMTPLQEDA